MQDPLVLPTWPSSLVGLGGVEGDQWAEIKVVGREPPVFGGGDFTLYPANSREFCLGRLSSQFLGSWKHLEESKLQFPVGEHARLYSVLSFLWLHIYSPTLWP